MAACQASSSLCCCPSSTGDGLWKSWVYGIPARYAPGGSACTVAGNLVPAKQTVLNKSPKSNLLPPKNGRVFFVKERTQSKYRLLVRAEIRDRKGGGGGDFVTGFVLGGVLFGALGYLFAPQVNKLLSAVERELDLSKQLPKGLDDDEGLAKTRRNLNEKIAQLNAAIDDVSAQLRADDKTGGQQAGSTAEFESAA